MKILPSLNVEAPDFHVAADAADAVVNFCAERFAGDVRRSRESEPFTCSSSSSNSSTDAHARTHIHSQSVFLRNVARSRYELGRIQRSAAQPQPASVGDGDVADESWTEVPSLNESRGESSLRVGFRKFALSSRRPVQPAAGCGRSTLSHHSDSTG